LVTVIPAKSLGVIPAKAGIQNCLIIQDSRLRGDDESQIFYETIRLVFILLGRGYTMNTGRTKAQEGAPPETRLDT
jgi:hypothetical protein